MEKAGYLVRQQQDASKKRSLAGAALATVEDLTPEEEEELMNYLAYLRSKAKKPRQS